MPRRRDRICAIGVNSEVVQQEVTSGAGDKIIKCLAVIGAIATAKTAWQPLKNWLGGKSSEAQAKEEEEKKEDGLKNGKPKS